MQKCYIKPSMQPSYTSKMLPQGDSCKKANKTVYDSRLITFPRHFCFFFGLNTLIVTLITPLTIALNTGVKKAAEWAIQNVGHIKHLVAAGLESIAVCPFGLFLRFGITILRSGATLTVGLITTLRRTLDSGDARPGPWVKQKAIKILEWVSQRGYTVAELTVRLIKQTLEQDGQKSS